jgi:Protein of unknown function (DUF2852)
MAVILMILGFIWWWPLGLIVLGFLIARKRHGYWRHQMFASDGQSWNCDHRSDRFERKMARMQEKMERVRSRFEGFRGRNDWFGSSPSSGNHAFDEYRTETLKRLEDEQREFKEFLERLRFAKDRAEFEKFMAERRERPFEPGAEGGAPSPGPSN